MKHYRHKQKRNIKISTKIMVIIMLIFFLTIYIYKSYINKASDKITEVSKIKLEKFTESFLSKNLSYKMFNNENLNNILVINKNSYGEILYVDYDLKEAYRILEVITDKIYDDIKRLENGEYDFSDEDIICTKNALGLKIPMFIYSNSPFIVSFGPKLYVKMDFVGSILTNIKTKITNYGFNNALVELYVTVRITEKLTTPVLEDNLVIDYDVLVASKVINGRVPEFYGSNITEESNIIEKQL